MINHFTLRSTPIEGLQLIERSHLNDSRGFFTRMFCQHTLQNLLKGKSIRQVNHTLTRQKGTIRGLHFQYPPYAEVKIVTCLRGKVWDIAVDLRKGSPTFLHHHAVLLTQENYRSYLIPEGFAHGFQALTSDCEMLYLHTADYAETFEGAFNALDPELLIKWPEIVTERSTRDASHPMLTEDFQGIEL